MKSLVGLLLALLIGAGCALAGIPVPAPGAFSGAFLVMGMTAGYVVADYWLTRADGDAADAD